MNRIFLSAYLLIPIIAQADTRTYVCNYTSTASPSGLERPQKRFALTFLIDPNNQKAYMVGNNGSSEVRPIKSGEGVTFVEVTGTGNVMTTTIAPSLESVHSRNTVLFGDLVPSQYYGKCVIK